MNFRWLSWKDDSFFSTQGTILKYDKLEHMLGWFALTCILIIISIFSKMNVLFPGIISLIAGIAWEIKDGYLDWEKYGWIGGEGFSWKDLIADLLGIVIAYILLGIFFLHLMGQVN